MSAIACPFLCTTLQQPSTLTSTAALASVEAILVGVDNIGTGLAIISELPQQGGAESVASAVPWASAQLDQAAKVTGIEIQVGKCMVLSCFGLPVV